MLDEAINLPMHADEPHLIPVHLLLQIMLSDKPPQIMGLLFFWGKEANEGNMIFRLRSSERSTGLQQNKEEQQHPNREIILPTHTHTKGIFLCFRRHKIQNGLRSPQFLFFLN